LLLAFNMARSSVRGTVAGNNPWDGESLEWATSSPPPPQNFTRIPVVTSGSPLWENRKTFPTVTGLRADRKEVLVSTLTEAEPDLREPSPDPSIWPLLAAIAIGITFLWSVYTPWAVIYGAVPITVTLVGWFWPKGTKEDES